MLKRLGWRVVLLAFAGSVTLAAAALLWLQIPDSHVWEFGVSVVVGLALVVGAVWLKASIVRRIRLGTGATGQAMAVMAVWIIVGWGLVQAVERLSVHVVERAGYWNSRLSAHQRTIFTETRLEDWQNDAISTLLWFVIPGLLLPVIVETVSGGGLATVGRVYRRWQMWLAVGLASTVGCWTAEKLTAWHPAESVRGEVVSAVARLGVLYVLLLAIGLVTVTVVAELLARAESTETGAVERPWR